MSRKAVYPKVMCTQHPDSASKYISTQEEPEEGEGHDEDCEDD